MAPLSKSRSAPVIGGLRAKSQGASIQKTGRIAWAEAEIAKAQKALLVTTEQMRQDSASFMLSSDFGDRKKQGVGGDKAFRSKLFQSKRNQVDEEIIPDDFFSHIREEVDKYISETTPTRSQTAMTTPQLSPSPTNQAGLTLSPLARRPSSEGVDLSDFVVASPSSEATARPGADTTQKRLRIQTESLENPYPQAEGSPGRPMTQRRHTEDAALLSDAAQRNMGVSGVSTYAFASSMSAPTGALERPLSTRTEEVTPRCPALLSCSVDDLLENLKAAVEASCAEAASMATATPARTEEDDKEALFFWEREIKTEEDQEAHDMEQAIWRFRKYLRDRFGSARKAWEVLESARFAVGQSFVEGPTRARMDDTLSLAELRIALSRLGIKLPSVTGCAKVRDLIGLIDRNSSKHLSFKELMGDEEKDPSLRPEARPPDRETWQTGVHQPRWAINWDVGLFDKEMRERVISCDILQYHKLHEDKPKFTREKGDKPLWMKYKETAERHRIAREAMIKAKEDEELQECTFKPDMEYSRKTGSRILAAKKNRRARSVEEKSIHQTNYENMVRTRTEMDADCTFQPELCLKSKRIHSDILESGKSVFNRLANKERHDRMNHVTFLTKEVKEMLSFKPKTEDYKGLRARTGNIYERLFHHEKHEFWHGDKRGLHPDEEANLSTNTKYTRQNQHFDNAVGVDGKAFRQAMKATPSARSHTSSPSRGKGEAAGDPRGEHTLEYRHQMLGMMEACERWGTRMDDQSMRQWEQKMGRLGGQASQPSSATASRSASPSPGMRGAESPDFAGQNWMSYNGRNAAGPPTVPALSLKVPEQSRPGAKVREKTPPPARARPAAAPDRRTATPPRTRAKKP